jgi:diacylglycerol kinase family enzyme
MASSDAPLHLIYNRKSGSGTGPQVAELAQKLCRDAGRELHLHTPRTPRQLPQLARQALAAARADGGVIAVAGGDGSVRTVAQLLVGTSVPLAVIPAGTFNFFARNHAVPEEPEGALRVALEGRLRAVDLGEVNGEVFLINASFGLYSRLIRAREAHTRRWGRNRIVAIVSTAFTLLRGHPAMGVELASGDVRQRIETPMVFVGNNALQLRSVALDVARCAQESRLAVVVMRPVGGWQLARLTLRGLFRMLEAEQSLDSFCADAIAINHRRRVVEVVLDGERLPLATPLRFRIRCGALELMVPDVAE